MNKLNAELTEQIYLREELKGQIKKLQAEEKKLKNSIISLMGDSKEFDYDDEHRMLRKERKRVGKPDGVIEKIPPSMREFLVTTKEVECIDENALATVVKEDRLTQEDLDRIFGITYWEELRVVKTTDED